MDETANDTPDAQQPNDEATDSHSQTVRLMVEWGGFKLVEPEETPTNGDD